MSAKGPGHSPEPPTERQAEAPTGSSKSPSARTLIGLVVAREREADERQDKVVGALLEERKAEREAADRRNAMLIRLVVLAVAGAFALAGVKVALGDWLSAEPAPAKFDADNMQEGEKP